MFCIAKVKILLHNSANIRRKSFTKRKQLHNNLTNFYTQSRNAPAQAATYFKKAAESFAARRDKYNESRAQMGLYEALKASNPSEAGQHLLRYATLKDSIYQQDVEQAISQYNVKYKTEELALKQEQERLEKRVILFGAIALMIVLLLIVMVNIYTSRIRLRNHIAFKKLSDMRDQFFTNHPRVPHPSNGYYWFR